MVAQDGVLPQPGLQAAQQVQPGFGLVGVVVHKVAGEQDQVGFLQIDQLHATLHDVAVQREAA